MSPYLFIYIRLFQTCALSIIFFFVCFNHGRHIDTFTVVNSFRHVNRTPGRIFVLMDRKLMNCDMVLIRICFDNNVQGEKLTMDTWYS